jgi:hypothetical protein
VVSVAEYERYMVHKSQNYLLYIHTILVGVLHLHLMFVSQFANDFNANMYSSAPIYS